MSTEDEILGELLKELEDAKVALTAALEVESKARSRRTAALNIYNGITKRIDAAALEVESKARSRRTAALNVYNGITKRIDAAMRNLKKESPRDSDWFRDTLEKQAMT